MACTSKIFQTVDNRHMNRHLDYLYAGPTVNFVDLQTTPQIGRRLQILTHIVECINNHGELPLDCVVPTPETEVLFGGGKGSKTVRGMRMKSATKRASKELELTSVARAGEKWVKTFERGTDHLSATLPRPICHTLHCPSVLSLRLGLHPMLPPPASPPQPKTLNQVKCSISATTKTPSLLLHHREMRQNVLARGK